MTLVEDFLFWTDEQISVKTPFWSDIKWLAWLPMWPFLATVMIWFENEPLRQGALIIGFVLSVAWTAFLFRRRHLKKKTWIEPTRFSDENGGY